MEEELTFFVGGKEYVVKAFVDRDDGKILVSAVTMTDINLAVANEMLGLGTPINREEFEFLKDVSGVTLKRLVNTMISMGRTEDLKAAFETVLSTPTESDV